LPVLDCAQELLLGSSTPREMTPSMKRLRAHLIIASGTTLAVLPGLALLFGRMRGGGSYCC
jgi:hypothetical protein